MDQMDISHHFDENNPGDNIAIDNSHTGVMMNRVRKVSPMPEENGRKYDNPTVEEALHYPILMLKVGGFYFENFRWTKSVLARILFDVLVMAMALAIVIRIIAGFLTNGDFSDKLMGRIVFAVANISNIVMYPVLIINTTRNLPRVLAKFSAFQAENGFATNVRKLKRRITGISIFSVILSIYFLASSNIVSSSRFFDESGVMVSRLLPFRYTDGYVYDFVSVIDSFTVTILSFFMYLQLVIVFVLSYLIIQEFHDVTKTADTIKQQTEVTESEVQNLRWRHFQVTELLQTANSIIQPNVLLLYIIMLPSICLTVYGVVYSTLGLFDVMILASLLITNTIAVCLITATGAIINSKVRSTLLPYICIWLAEMFLQYDILFALRHYFVCMRVLNNGNS